MSSSPAAAKRLDNAVEEIDMNITGVQGDAGNLADLDRLFETVKKEKCHINILFSSAVFYKS
jgi:short-subunit dehydrogenase involved in D-alanine esterification of teichoic acids